MDLTQECWTIPSGLFRKDSCGGHPGKGEPDGKSLSTEQVLGYMLAGIEFRWQIAEPNRMCKMPYIAGPSILGRVRGAR